MARVLTHEKTSPNHAAIAAKIGKERSYVSKLLAGKRTASIELALQIFDVSGIAIGPLKGKTEAEINAIRSAQAVLSGVAA